MVCAGWTKNNQDYEMPTMELKLPTGLLQLHSLRTGGWLREPTDSDTIMAIGSLFGEPPTFEQEKADRLQQMAFLNPNVVVNYLNEYCPTKMTQCIYDGEYIYIPHPESIITQWSTVDLQLIATSQGAGDGLLLFALRNHLSHIRKYTNRGYELHYTPEAQQLLDYFFSQCVADDPYSIPYNDVEESPEDREETNNQLMTTILECRALVDSA